MCKSARRADVSGVVSPAIAVFLTAMLVAILGGPCASNSRDELERPGITIPIDEDKGMGTSLKLTDPAVLVLRWSEKEATRLRSGSLGAGHVLLGVLEVQGDLGRHVLKELNVNVDHLGTNLEGSLSCDREGSSPPPASAEYEAVLRYAQEESGGDAYVATEHLLIGVLRGADETLVRQLEAAGVSVHAVRAGLATAVKAQSEIVVACEKCGQPATVHVTSVDAGCAGIAAKKAHHYCERCSVSGEDSPP